MPHTQLYFTIQKIYTLDNNNSHVNIYLENVATCYSYMP